LQQSYVTILNIALKLNTQLKKPNKRLTKIQDIKEKEILTTSDFELLYNFSKGKQATLRGRINNSLPYRKDGSKSKSSNTKILYNKKEVDIWYANNYSLI
jgi:hypothetical protein